MKRIFKHEITHTGNHTLSLPEGSTFLSVAGQHETPCLWVVSDAARPLEDVEICTFGSREVLPEDFGTLTFLGTVILFKGELALHIFRRLNLK